MGFKVVRRVLSDMVMTSRDMQVLFAMVLCGGDMRMFLCFGAGLVLRL